MRLFGSGGKKSNTAASGGFLDDDDFGGSPREAGRCASTCHNER